MNIESIHSVFFIGIGGIGMSALARYFKACGKIVGGYDRQATALSHELEDEGMLIHYIDDTDSIANMFLDKQTTLVVYTPAVPATNEHLKFFTHKGFAIRKRAEVVGDISNEKKNICVAGTHGKTSIATLIAHLLQNTSEKCNAFLGGISKNYNKNLLLQTKSEIFVVEADEFDRSFLQLNPFVAVISSLDADHLDIYEHEENVKDAFKEFVGKIQNQGFLILKHNLALKLKEEQNYFKYTYSLEDAEADYFATDIRLKNKSYVFSIATPTEVIQDVELGIGGLFNVENAIAAVAAIHVLGLCNAASVKKGLKSFAGIKRRFEFHVNEKNNIYIDDYAHHPKELETCINAIKELFPREKILGIFQPHLYSRTRDFAAEFAESLKLLDEVVLLDVYPAREKPIQGVNSELILEKIENKNKTISTKKEVLDIVKKSEKEIIVTFGAGDISELVEPIKNIVKTRAKA
ncbi:MAG: UDP-N-acetylmuramate--L-alanine ligase [Bacteroidia bacterium]|nr:MAG: UDP-N-acetylmuramate--L-alanine ligase [Bacteroidia bacterium]PIE86410.1 MAG: UDP-N-acetylmuramate--L-alanine ligase [Bacteroidia bacterium]